MTGEFCPCTSKLESGSSSAVSLRRQILSTVGQNPLYCLISVDTVYAYMLAESRDTSVEACFCFQYADHMHSLGLCVSLCMPLCAI